MRFRGEFEYLSNMFEAPLLFEGAWYRCAEAAFQAAKVPANQRESFTRMSGKEAKHKGRKVPLDVAAWNAQREAVMWQVLWAKFTSNPYLGAKLLNVTGEIVEHNSWGDTYWGVDERTGEGANRLGVLLMGLRDYLVANCGAKSNKRSPVPGAVYCGRGSIWGNPFVMHKEADREAVIAQFAQYAMQDATILGNLHQLRGKTLECFCAPLFCHTDVLRLMAGTWLPR